MSENKEEQISIENDLKDILLKAIKEKNCNLLKSTYLDDPTKEEEHKFIFNFINQETYLDNDFIIYIKGYCYRDSIGVKQDFKKAIELFEEAANMNNSDAINSLGFCYDYGIGINKDLKKAIELYEKAAKMNNTDAIYNMAYCYRNGYVVSKDYKKAFELYYKYHDLTGRNVDHILIDINNKDPTIFITLLSLKKENNLLKKENEELKKEIDHLKFCPGLSYQEAKADFEKLKESSLFYKKIENNF